MSITLTGAGSYGAWTPASISGYQYGGVVNTLAATGKLWQNGAKTTPATAAADPVRVLSSNGVDLTAPSDAARMVLASSGGRLVLSSDGVNDGLGDQSGAVSFSGATTFVARVSQTADAASTRLFRSGTVNALLALRRTSGASVYVAPDLLYNPQLVFDSSFHVVVLSKPSGGNWTLRIDGSSVTLAAGSGNFGPFGFGAGGGIGPNETFTGLIDAFYTYSAYLAPADVTRVETYLTTL